MSEPAKTSPVLLDAPIRRRSLLAWSVVVALLGALVAVRSRDYLAVDGAVRCLEVFHRQEPFIHGNNHLLYPVNVWLWHGLLGLFQMRAETPIDYLGLTQVMNAVATTVALAALWVLVRAATGSERVAWVTAAGLGLTRAFLLHATNSAEAMVGFMWSLLALVTLVAALGRRQPPLAVLAGGMFALAMASYQSMALYLPAAVFLAWAWPRAAPAATRSGTRPVMALALLGGSAAGVAVIYGTAYSLDGTTGVTDMARRFLTLTGAGIFGGFSARSLAVLPVGLVVNLWPLLPEDFSGFRSLLRLHGDDATMPILGAALLPAAGVLLLAALGLRWAWPRLEARARVGVQTAGVALATSLAAAAGWDPFYDKLWLQPLAALAFMLGVATAVVPPARLGTGLRLAAACLGALLVLNLGWVVAAHRRPTPGLEEARQVAAIVKERDLLVQGWDRVSTLYGSIWAPGRHGYDLVTSAAELGPAAGADLDRHVRAARARGGEVYFLGLLDQPPAEWETFLGGRAGLPYASLERYRQRATAVTKLPVARGRLTLWRVEAQPGS